MIALLCGPVKKSLAILQKIAQEKMAMLKIPYHTASRSSRFIELQGANSILSPATGSYDLREPIYQEQSADTR
jgi:hypothetical protein